MAHTLISPDLSIAEAGRLIMADELTTILAFLPEMRSSADGLAVHETRKAIRRTFTLFKLFTPYFAPGILEQHRPGLRKIMRRLAPCRDTAVFRLKLADYNQKIDQPLNELAAWWDERQSVMDGRLMDYLGRKQVTRVIDRYSSLVRTTGAGLPRKKTGAPMLVRFALPGMVMQHLGAVRAWGAIMPDATPSQFHQLRIQFKELRYTLTFFEDILSDGAGEMFDLSRRMQDLLGDLNDANVADEILEQMKCCRAEAATYRQFQRSELARLMDEFRPLYAAFDRPEVRRDLAVTLANL